MIVICISQICRNITEQGIVEYARGTDYILGSWHGDIQLPENKTELRGYLLPDPNSLSKAVLLYDDVMYYYNETEIKLLQKKRFSLFERHAISDGALKILDPVDAKIWYFDLLHDEKYIYGISNQCRRLLLRMGLHNDITFLGQFALINGLKKSYINFKHHPSSNFVSCNVKTILTDNQLEQKYYKHHQHEAQYDELNSKNLQEYIQLKKMMHDISTESGLFYRAKNNLVSYTHQLVFGPGGNGIKLPEELTVNFSDQQISKRHISLVPELCVSQIPQIQSNQTQKTQKQLSVCHDQLNTCKSQLHNAEQNVKDQQIDIQMLKQRLSNCQQDAKLKHQQQSDHTQRSRQNGQNKFMNNTKTNSSKQDSNVNRCEHLEKKLRQLQQQQQSDLSAIDLPTQNIVKAVKFEAVLLIFAVLTYSSFGLVWFIMW